MYFTEPLIVFETAALPGTLTVYWNTTEVPNGPANTMFVPETDGLPPPEAEFSVQFVAGNVGVQIRFVREMPVEHVNVLLTTMFVDGDQ
jgi:hypothetical protein